jgi:hypothetical protein
MDRDSGPVVQEFTHQAESFNRVSIVGSADTLDRLIDALSANADQCWLINAPSSAGIADGAKRFGKARIQRGGSVYWLR